ncbi:MAG: ribosome biogenesis GTP-binding protein YihA/YsxC [Nitrospinaceae bacterium]
MKIISAEFLTGAVTARQYPSGTLPELAFAGRSNVGKSALINSLLNRKKLVKTSSTPGKTREINFFKINGEMIFADLPGYGFAKVPVSIKKHWKKMVEQYLLNRKTLAGVVFILDIRRNPTQMDLDLKDWLESCGIRFVLVATKADKLTRAEVHRQTRKIHSAFFEDAPAEIIVYSSKSRRGRKELWNRVLQWTRTLCKS